jgi:hypothetical protein
MKEILGLIAVIMAVIGVVPYVLDIIRGKTKPHLYTYLVWTIVASIIFAGQVVAGAGPGAWTTAVLVLMAGTCLVLSFKYGTEDVTTLDKFFLAGALVSMIPWVLTKDPVISVLLATTIDILATLPTIRKTYNNPWTETLFSWAFSVPRQFLVIAAISVYSVTTLAYPIGILIANSVVVGIIVLRRRALPAQT